MSSDAVATSATAFVVAQRARVARRLRSPSPRTDLAAALVVTALMVPQALGYAALAGVPVEAGLYAIPLALIAYALFGSSPQLIVGPVSTVSVLTGSIVAARGAQTPAEALGYATALAIVSGVLLVIAGLLQIGWIAEFLSKPIITGFVFGLSVAIIIGEAPILLGLGRARGTGLDRVRGVIDALIDAHRTTALVGVVALAILFVGNRWRPRLPWGLLVVVASIVVSRQADLAGRGVETIGTVPAGLPAPSMPDLALSQYGQLIASAAGLALVGLAESLSAGRLYAVRNGYRIRADQEFIATGVANVAAGFAGGIGVAGSLSKTATADQSGAKSQLTGMATAAIVVVVLVAFASSLSALPRAVLSAVVIQAVWSLLDLDSLARYRRVRRNDFTAAGAALVGVLVLGVLPGLLVAVALSVLGLVYRSGRLEVEVLGKVKHEKAAWGSLERHPGRATVEGVVVLRLSAPLFWVNAARASALVMDRVEARPETFAVVIDLEATNQLDVTAADELGSLIRRLRRRGFDVYLVRVMHPARQVLEATGLLDEIGDDHMWRTISQGVRAARKAAAARADANADPLADPSPESTVDPTADTNAESEAAGS